MKFFIVLFIFFFLDTGVTAAEPSSIPQSSSIKKNNTSKKSPLKNQKRKTKKKKNIPPMPPPPPPPPPPQEDIAEILYPEKLGETVSQAVVRLANRIDSFFGSERSLDEKNGSTLRIVPSYIFFEHKKPIAELGVNLNLKLIHLEQKAKQLEKAIRDEFVTSSPSDNKTSSNIQKEKEKPSSENDWHYNFESKLASRPAIYYSGKLRARKNYTGHILFHHFSLSAGWDTDDQWSQKTTFTSDRAINEALLFRFNNDLSWYITEKLLQTSHGPSLIHTINKYNFVSYNFQLIFGNNENKLEHWNTVYSINFRHGTPSQKIFIDLIPMYSYPKEDYFSEVKSFEVRLEYFFGDL